MFRTLLTSTVLILSFHALADMPPKANSTFSSSNQTAAAASFCSSSIDHCCSNNPTWAGTSQAAQPCQCTGKSENDCNADTLSCQWVNDPAAQSFCASLTDPDSCNGASANACSWNGDASGGFCVSNSCEPRPCYSLTCTSPNDCSDSPSAAGDYPAYCTARPDCDWLLFNDGSGDGKCISSQTCSCADPSNIQEFCPCHYNQADCQGTSGCNWNQKHLTCNGAAGIAASIATLFALMGAALVLH